jgi:hypothetical protein
MKDYSYIIMLMPTVRAIHLAFARPLSRAIPYVLLWIGPWSYLPLFLALGAFVCLRSAAPKIRVENGR